MSVQTRRSRFHYGLSRLLPFCRCSQRLECAPPRVCELFPLSMNLPE